MAIVMLATLMTEPSLMMFAPLMMFPKLMAISVIPIGISIAIIVVRVVIITIPGIIPCTTCQHEPEYEHCYP